MIEYISREAVVRYLKGYSEKECNSNSPYGMITSSVLNKAERALSEMPAADVQSIRRGRWIDIYEYCKMNDYIPSGVAVYHWCSECMKEQEKTSDFCPNCGADMR